MWLGFCLVNRRGCWQVLQVRRIWAIAMPESVSTASWSVECGAVGLPCGLSCAGGGDGIGGAAEFVGWEGDGAVN